MFMMLGGTVLFEVGMLNKLFHEFKRIILMHGLYMLLSITLGVMRIVSQ